MFEQAFMNIMAKCQETRLNETGHENDYHGPDGLRMCGTCRKPRQMRIDVPLIGERVVPVLCECDKIKRAEQVAREEALQRQMRIDELRMNGILNRDHLGMTFAADDGSDPRMATIATNYVNNWREIRKQHAPGLLLHGGVGGGKTFWAAAIANALIDRGYSAIVTNIPSLISSMSQDFERDKARVLKNIAEADLLVLDDIGFERSTSYGHEKMYEIIDARYLAKGPLIVTTNLSLKELDNPSQMEYKRVFDRIIGMCQPVHVAADGRRKRMAMECSAQMRELLGM